MSDPPVRLLAGVTRPAGATVRNAWKTPGRGASGAPGRDIRSDFLGTRVAPSAATRTAR